MHSWSVHVRKTGPPSEISYQYQIYPYMPRDPHFSSFCTDIEARVQLYVS